MTYSTDYRKQVLSSIKDGMTMREAAAFYRLSTSTIHSWQQDLVPKQPEIKHRPKYRMKHCLKTSRNSQTITCTSEPSKRL